MNGYPDHIIEKTNTSKLKDFTSPTLHTVKKCTVHLDLPWFGTPSVRHKIKIKVSLKQWFFAEEQRVILHLAHFFLQSKRTCCLLCL